MRAAEADEFDAMLKEWADVLCKKFDPKLGKAYWNALKDLPLATIRRRGDEHVKRNKFFPKPCELRPRDERPEPSVDANKSAADFRYAEQRNVRNWDDLQVKDPLGAKWLVLDAYVARVDAQEDPRSIAHAEKMAFARSACERLLADSDDVRINGDPYRRALIARLLGRATVFLGAAA